MRNNRFVAALISILLGAIVIQPVTSYADTTTQAMPFLLPCTNRGIDCIESITAVMPDGKTIQGVQTGRISHDVLSAVDAGLKYVQGPQVEWEFPGLTFQNGSDRAVLMSYYWSPDNPYCWNNGSCALNEEELGIYMQVSRLDGNRPDVQVTGPDAAIACPNSPLSCDLGSPSWMFNTNANFHVVFRMPTSFNPLYTQGRINNLNVKVLSQADSQSNFHDVEVDFTPQKLQNVDYALPDPTVIQQALYLTDEPALWVYGLQNNKSQSLGQCATIGGLQIATNAYFMSNPQWDAASNSINVQLTSTHLDTDGSISKGYLEVSVPLTMAKCLWGVDISGNVQARFSLSYPDGSTPDVITVSSNVADGSYRMIAAGFHFSSPTISFQMQDKNADPVATPTPTPSPASTRTVASPIPLASVTAKPIPASSSRPKSQLKAIDCQKGSVKKKLIAKQCPNGYKLVS